jgi:hypothetical protein
MKDELFERISDTREAFALEDLAVKSLGVKAINKIIKSGNFTDDQYEKLYEIFENEMPYGTKKARTGDPYKFIYDRLAGIDFKNIRQTTRVLELNVKE